jgi:hypothetical protein
MAYFYELAIYLSIFVFGVYICKETFEAQNLEEFFAYCRHKREQNIIKGYLVQITLKFYRRWLKKFKKLA